MNRKTSFPARNALTTASKRWHIPGYSKEFAAAQIIPVTYTVSSPKQFLCESWLALYATTLQSHTFYSYMNNLWSCQHSGVVHGILAIVTRCSLPQRSSHGRLGESSSYIYQKFPQYWEMCRGCHEYSQSTCTKNFPNTGKCVDSAMSILRIHVPRIFSILGNV